MQRYKKIGIGLLAAFLILASFNFAAAHFSSQSTSTSEWLGFGRTLNNTRFYPTEISLVRLEQYWANTAYVEGGDIAASGVVYNNTYFTVQPQPTYEEYFSCQEKYNNSWYSVPPIAEMSVPMVANMANPKVILVIRVFSTIASL